TSTGSFRRLGGIDPDEDLPVALLARIGLDGFGGRRADRLTGLEVECASVARASDAVLDELAGRQQAVEVRAVVGRRVRLAVQSGDGELVVLGVEPADDA